MPRKIIYTILDSRGLLIALCDDGTLWRETEFESQKWRPINISNIQELSFEQQTLEFFNLLDDLIDKGKKNVFDPDLNSILIQIKNFCYQKGDEINNIISKGKAK